MSDVSPGERAVLRLRWFVFDAGARPVVIASSMILLAALTAMVSGVVRASTNMGGGFRDWVFFAQFGFTTDVELAALIAVILLSIDARTGDPFRGQRPLFAASALIAAAGIVANIGTIVVYLTETGVSVLPFGTTAEAWTDVIARYLASAVVASIVCWIALSAMSSMPTPEGSVREL